jgi:trans-feruloyl-CoA hydratase/vanillin synthase
MSNYEGRWTTVKVEIEEGIAWVILNRPEKRNAMSPTLNREMIDVLETLEQDPAAGVLVLTGAGEAWTAGMDLKEYFREVDAGPEILQEKIRREASQWQWKLLRMYAKPTIAMVNGWCFGGGFSRWWRATWRSVPTKPPSACRKSTGASRRATWSARPWPTPWAIARRSTTS